MLGHPMKFMALDSNEENLVYRDCRLIVLGGGIRIIERNWVRRIVYVNLLADDTRPSWLRWNMPMEINLN